MQSFGNWLVKSQRLARNPFAHLLRLNAKVDVRVERRALNPAERTRLIDAVDKSEKQFRKLTGPDRAVLYLMATMTGLRANELATLRLSAFNFKAEPPTVPIAAENEKSGRGAELPLHPFVMNRLSSWLRTRPKPATLSIKPQDELLWPGTWSEKAAEMFRRDLAEARAAWLKEVETIADELDLRTKSDFLKAESANGKKADFHTLRHSFITMLASSGVHPQVAPQLARHSTITLTMNQYSRARLVDLNAAVENLPSLAPISKLTHDAALTGTTGETRLEVDSTGPATGPQIGTSR